MNAEGNLVSEKVKRIILRRKGIQRNHKIFSITGENMSPYIKELPGRFGVARLPAAVFNSLVSDNEVVPLAADLLDRKHESFGGQLFLDALEEL